MRVEQWLLIGGGLAMDVEYFVRGINHMLSFNSTPNKLIIIPELVPYQQFGGDPQKPLPDSDRLSSDFTSYLINDLVAFAKEFINQPYSIVAHSFGAFYALLFVQKIMEMEGFPFPLRVILFSPIPLDTESLENSMKRAFNRYPLSIQNRLKALEDDPQGIETLQIIEPFYCNGNFLLDSLRPTHYNNPVAMRQLDLIGRFNLLPVLENIRENVLGLKIEIIHGDADPFVTTSEISGEHVHIISDCGHYPFSEKPDQASNAIKFIYNCY